MSDVSGLFIYHDSSNRPIYSNFFMKNSGYKLIGDDIKTYSIYSLRFISSLLLILLLWYILKLKFLTSLLIGLAFYIITTLFFYFTFLRHLEKVNNFTKKKESFIETSAKKQKPANVLFSILACICLIAFSAFGLTKATETRSIIADYIIIAFAVVYLVYMVLVLVKISRNATQRYVERMNKENNDTK